MTDKEQKEHARLLRLWALKKVTKAQLVRCLYLDQKARAEAERQVFEERAS